ncbi:unnamed protein product [Leptosia nina]|uniref:Uncharacterized protein n=1 Tax=Leptosia nina TaxID=320188 RepID=A0AAV1JJ71_9NEOP
MGSKKEHGIKPTRGTKSSSTNKVQSGMHLNKNVNQDVRDKFNFPDIQYQTVSPPMAPIYFHNFLKDVDTVPKVIKNNSKLNSPKQKKKLRSKPRSPTPDIKGTEFSSAPSYRDVGIFPDVEYPLSNKDIWRPNYWNCSHKAIVPSSTNYTSRNSRKTSLKSSIKTNSKAKPGKPIPTAQKVKNLNYNNRHQHFDFTEDFVESDFPKKRSHDESPNYDLYMATPTPYTQQEEQIKNALRTRIYSNIAEKAKKTIANNKLQTEKLSNTEAYHFGYKNDNEILEEILFPSPPHFNTMKEYNETTTQSPNYDTYTTVETWTNVFTAMTEKPDQCKPTEKIGNDLHISKLIVNQTSLAINTADRLSPRGFIYNDSEVISEVQAHNRSDINEVMSHSNINATDKANNTTEQSESSLKLDDEFTTDVYPELSESGFVFSTISPPPKILLDKSWSNSEVLDPYKSLSYPDELAEYYIAVNE